MIKGDVQHHRVFTAEEKLTIVLESIQRDTTIEEVCRKYQVVRSVIYRWREEFKRYAHEIFLDKRDPKKKAYSRGFKPGESPDDLKKIIGELTVQNEILKKSTGVIGGKVKDKKEVGKVMLASNPKIKKSIIARALGFSRNSWYYYSKLEWKDKKVANQIESIYHDEDDTLGPKKLSKILKYSKGKIRRIMIKYNLVARRRKKKYHYHGKSHTTYPNIANMEDFRESLDIGVVYSDIFEFELADGCKVRGCFALLRQTRQILSLVFDYYMKASLVTTTLDAIPITPDIYIWHTDQGKQYGATATVEKVASLGLNLSMSRAGTPTDNPFAERYVSTFKHAVVRKRRYYTLGDFLKSAQKWVNFYNNKRPHESLNQVPPNTFAQQNGWPIVPNITKLTV